MKITRLFAAAALSWLPLSVAAETTLTVHYPMPGFFKDVMDQISTKFMADNPDIKIRFANPSANYDDGIQLVLRQAGTSAQPDVTFIGLNRLRILEQRNISLDMAPLVAAEGNMAEQGFSDTILGLAQVNGKQMGLPFATSNPIMYYNADLFRKAGLNPEEPPKTWDEVLAAAAKIDALGNGIEGMDFRWQGGEWMYQTLLFGAGGTMMNADDTEVAFNGPEGLAAFDLLERMVKEGGMPLLTEPASVQAFTAGTIGILLQTTGGLRSIINAVGEGFDLRTTTMPLLDAEKGRVVTGGNALVILAQDKEKQEAAWKFAKFAAGPYGASVVVPGTGYVPNNTLAASAPEYLGDFYKENPLFQAGMKQMPLMLPWYAFPGEHSVRISQGFTDATAALVEGQITPQEAADQAAEAVRRLLPR